MRDMDLTEQEAQAEVNAAAATASLRYHERLQSLPRWRQWLVRKLAPAWPFEYALRGCTVHASKPLTVPPGVAFSNVIFQTDEDAGGRSCP